ncbi:unnamed protein product [Dracunculus medinensis]|uniref:Transposase n=1 Tax=Dracunculus medinensis TaxID=318479 RepID=A0A0N4UNH6_DRAME|nr:unnamed protein product [Dracunculus medinensis]
MLVDDRNKDKFYAELQLLIKSLSKHDMVVIEENWNARVGHNAAAMIGKYGIGDRWANGKRLVAMPIAGEHEHCLKTMPKYEYQKILIARCFEQLQQHGGIEITIGVTWP